MDFWIENIPYVDISENEREYLVTEPDNIVYISRNNRIYPILFKHLTVQMLPAYLCFISQECQNITSKVKAMFPIDKTKKLKMNNKPFEQAETFKTPNLEVYTISYGDISKILAKNIIPIYLESPPSSMHEGIYIFSEYVEHYMDDNALQIPTYQTFFDYMMMVADEYGTIGDYDLQDVFYSPFATLLDQLISKRIRIGRTADILKAYEPDSEKYKKLKALGGKKEKTEWGFVYNPLFITPRAQNRIDDFQKYLSELGENSKIMDFGAGNGEILIGFGNRLAIKKKENLIAIDRENYIQENAKALVSFFPMEADTSSWEMTDLILAFQVFHHIKKTPTFTSILRGINDKLKPGGYLFLREHDCRNIFIEKLINIEHLLYDIVQDSKSFEQARQSLKDTAYMDVKHWHKTITENCPDLVFKDFNFAKTQTNPTLYFNMIYQKKALTVVPFDKNVIDSSKKTILDYSFFTTMGSESRYSSLMPWHIASLLNVKNYLPSSPKKIVDLTAHIGVDTIFYGILYPDADILAIENNKDTFLKLEYNLKKYGEILNRKGTFKALLSDSSKLLDDPRITGADIVYIDPPWGGTEYKKEAFIGLKLGDLDIINVVLKLLERVKTIVLKIPLNFDKQSVYKSPLNKYKIKYFPVYAGKKQSFGLFIFSN